MKRAPHSYSRDVSGKTYWRSLGELHGSPAFASAAEREFPEGAVDAPDDAGRRSFLTLMGASLALGGLTACRRPEQLIVPYSRAPEEVVPGRPLFFATAMPFLGTAVGLLVESHEGRPTKIEGNPKHPESLGAATSFLQASVLDLYDPDRSDSPREHGEKRSWDEAATLLRRMGAAQRDRRGRGLVILTEGHRSPTLSALLGEVRQAMPDATIVRWDSFSRDASREGARMAFGKRLDPVLDLRAARTIVALDADVLAMEGSPLKQARGYAAGRSAPNPGDRLNRLYAIESAFSVTGATADHRLRLKSSETPHFTAALARELATAHHLDLGVTIAPQALGDREARYVRAIAADLAEHRGEGLVVAGAAQPAVVHALTALINHALGNVGRTVRFVVPFNDAADGPTALVELAKAIRAGKVETLLILGGNPAFDAPADADFAKALAAVPVSIHLGSSVDETSATSTWHLNRAHPLEAWSDVRTEDGTASVIQPLIAPLLGGRTDAEVVDLLLGRGRKAYELVQGTWRAAHSGLDFDRDFRRALHEGLWSDSQSALLVPTPRPEDVEKALGALESLPKGGAEGALEVTFRPDPHTYDGRFANNGWLQELPDPMYKLTWGNVAAISPATAKAHGLSDGDIVSVAIGRTGIRIPVLVAPGQADGSIALTVGHGRREVGRVGKGVGTDVAPLRQSDRFYTALDARIEKTGERVTLARTQEHFSTEGRPLVREGTVAEFAKDPDFAKKKVEHLPLISSWDEHKYEGNAWGMSIDLNACIGCAACTTACQAENNIPVVGVDGVRRSREMHWIRVDRYFEGTVADEPTSLNQPTLCNHCENAPCEQVCPVGATTHSPEGLNDMAYNRCVGTRYCANNCPFKVRRFNFLDYTATTEIGKMQHNPDVSIRSRGVMEKCTFCVQRINHAKIDAKKLGTDRVKDGTIKTACEQACPTQAIIFGDLNDPKSRVSQKVNSPLGYKLLEELNIKPRISYLAKVRNPNPALEGA